MSKKNWKAKNRRIHLEQVVNRYNIIDLNEETLHDEDVSFKDAKDLLGGIWADDMTPDAFYVYKRLKNPNISLDALNDMLMGVGYYAEVANND